jgi:hypothetical protein
MDGKKPIFIELIGNWGRDSMSAHDHLIRPTLQYLLSGSQRNGGQVNKADGDMKFGFFATISFTRIRTGKR